MAATSNSTTSYKAKILMTGIRVAVDIPQYFRELYGGPKEIEAKILADKENIAKAGYDVTLYYLDERNPQAGLDWLDSTLRADKFDGVMVGTGLRMVPPQTALFEKVMNVVIHASPESVFMFNDAPGGNFEAIKRNPQIPQ